MPIPVRSHLRAVSAARSLPVPVARLGFTLVELLVVISIITVLISLLLPALRSARTSGQRVQSLSNVRQLTMAMRMYTDDYKGSFPFSVLNADTTDGLQTWANQLRGRGKAITGYISDYRVFWSPARDQAFAQDHFKNDSNFSRPGFATYQRGIMPWENSGYRPMVMDMPQNPPASKHLLFMEAMDISWYYAVNYDGKSTVDPQAEDGIYFTYNGTATHSYVDGHGVATVGEDIGWKATTARQGDWMRSGQTAVYPNANLIKGPYYRYPVPLP